MQKIIAILVLLSSSASYGSYFQTYCSDAESFVQIADGHDETSVKLSKLVKDSRGGEKAQQYEVRPGSLIYNRTIIHSVDQYSEDSCSEDPGARYGEVKNEETRVIHLIIENRDGSRFPADTQGVSENLRFIEVYQLCVDREHFEKRC